MRILLLNPNVRPSFRVFQKIAYLNKGYPLSLVVLATYLRSRDYEVKIFDALGMNASDSLFKDVLRQYQPDAVGITAAFYSAVPAVEKAARISKIVCPRAPVIVGGILPTFMSRELLDHCPDIDYIVRGEGETVFFQLLEALRKEEDIFAIPSLAYRRSDQAVFINEGRPSRLRPLGIDSHRMRELFLFPKRLGFFTYPWARIYIEASRGCHNSCAFCVVDPMLGKEVHYKDPVQVVDEIEGYVSSLGNTCFTFVDSTFTHDKQYALSLLTEIEKRNRDKRPHWSYSFGTRVDSIDSDLLKIIKKTRCFFISFGVESFSSDELHAYNKRVVADQTKEAFRLCREHAIKTRALFFIDQFRYSTAEAIKTYVRNTGLFLKAIRPDYFSITPLIVYPHSFLYAQYEQEGRITGKSVEDVLQGRLISVPQWSEKDLYRLVYRMYCLFSSIKCSAVIRRHNT